MASWAKQNPDDFVIGGEEIQRAYLMAQRYFYNRFSVIKPPFTAYTDLIDHILPY